MDKDYVIQNYNLSDIIFVRDRKNYKIYIKRDGKNSRIKLKTSLLYVPFGVEKFYSKYIMNLSFHNLDTNNDTHNFYSSMLDIDTFFMNIKEMDIPTDIKLLIGNKMYVSCIRVSDGYKPLLRTHIKIIKKKIITKFISHNDPELCISEKNIKNKKGYFTIELGGLWINNDSYGLIWYLNGGRVYA